MAVLIPTARGAGAAGGGTIAYRLTGDWTDATVDIERPSFRKAADAISGAQ